MHTTGLAKLLAAALLVVPPGGLRGRAAALRIRRRAGSPADPLLLIGIDGLEWNLVLELLAEGRLPTLEGLMKRGTFGFLKTFEPTLSPVIWTSIATGKTADKHGINDFVVPGAGGEKRLTSSKDRKTKALWNILSDHSRTVSTVGWWATHPVEPVNGVMVSQTNTEDRVKLIAKGALLAGVPGQVHPPEQQDQIMEVLSEVDASLDELVLQVFGKLPRSPDPLAMRLMTNTAWAFRADATYHRIGAELLGERPVFDATLLYFGGPDVVGHRFWRYLKPDLYENRPRRKQIRGYGHIIPDYYAYIDGIVANLIQAAPPDVTVLIISDHGMHEYNVDGTYDGKAGSGVLSGHHRDAPPGVFIAAGRHIRTSPLARPLAEYRREDLVEVGGVLDVTPTILAMLRIPVAEDMDGRVLTHVFTPDFRIDDQPEPIATHDTPEFLASRGGPVPVDPGAAERYKQLESLGYFDSEDEEED